MQSLKILITAGASPAAFNIIKHLKSLGHYVVAADANEKALPLVRTMADKIVKVPFVNQTEYMPFMTEQIQTVDLVIPFIDEEIAQLIKHLDTGMWQKCLLPERNTTEICLFKNKFQTFCKDNDLPIAPDVSVSKKLPAVFKPNLGRGGKGVEIINNLALLDDKSSDNGIIQEFIKGEEFTIDALFSKNGQLIIISARRRDTSSGVSVIGTIVDPEPFFPIVEQISKVLKFRYLINIQIIKDDQDRLHIIEINPRIAGSIMFTVYSGFDFLKAAMNTFIGNKVNFLNKQKKIRIIRYWNEHVEDLST